MKKIARLWFGDGINILRDPSQVLLSAVPFLMWGGLRVLVPVIRDLIEKYLRFDVTPHLPFFYSFIIFVPAMMGGMLIGFLLIDDRDSGILLYWSVTPAGKTGFLLFRCTVPLVLGYFFTIIFLTLPAFITIGHFQRFLVSFIAALNGIIITLVLGAFAGNKIEAMAIAKALGILEIGPIVGYLVPEPWAYIAGILPPFWISRAFLAFQDGATGRGLLFSLAGFLLSAAMIMVLVRIFKKKTG